MRPAVLLLALGLTVGCSSQQESPALPVPTASVSASPTVQALPSPKQSGIAGEVEKAVLAHYAAINEASATGDTTSLRSTFTKDCTACETFADRLDALRGKGQRLDGALDVVSDVRVLADEGPAASAVVTYTITAHRLLDREGTVVGSFDSSQEQSNLALVRQPDGVWLVVDSIDALA